MSAKCHGAGQTYAGGLPGCRHIAAELRDELPNGEIFYSLKEAQIIIEQWRKHYNTVRPHSAPGYRPPAPQTMNPFLTPLDQAVQMQWSLNHAGTKNPSGQGASLELPAAERLSAAATSKFLPQGLPATGSDRQPSNQ
jgi:hypothetical protein